MKEPINTFTQNDYEIVKREVLYEGAYRLARYHIRIRKYDGGWSNIFTREILERHPAAAVLPYDPVLNQVVLIEQFRAGAVSDPKNPWIIEAIAGLYDPKTETAEEAIIREAEEEAGCKILDLYQISEYFASPGIMNETVTLFCGRVDASLVGGIHGLEEESEDIRTLVCSCEEAFQMLQQGLIKTSPALLSLMWLQQNREWLKKLWQAK